MTTTGLETFDRTLHESNAWLKRLMEELHTDDRHRAFVALRATLHGLRDRIGPENATHLAAQLPMLLRGLFFEGWRLVGTPTGEHTVEQFVARVSRELPASWASDAERSTKAVFAVMSEKLDAGEISKVVSILPAKLRELWPGQRAA